MKRAIRGKPSFDYRHGVVFGMATIGGVGIGSAVAKLAAERRQGAEGPTDEVKQIAIAGLSLVTLYVASQFSWGEWLTFEKLVEKTEKATAEVVEKALE